MGMVCGTLEIWKLFISSFTALGIWCSVVVALWLALRKKGRFKVKKVEVVTRNFNVKGKIKKVSYLNIDFENLAELPMEILGSDLEFIRINNDGTMSFSCNARASCLAGFSAKGACSLRAETLWVSVSIAPEHLRIFKVQ